MVTWRQYPTGEKDTLRLENFVDVIENLEPPTLSSVIENENGIIQLSYNLPLKITSESTSNFSLLVDNQQTTITSVALNPDDNRVLEITPSININSKSTALLNYDGMGGIKRLNDIAVPAFTNETVTLFLPNIADNAIYGFEDGGTDGLKLGNGIILVKFHLPTNKLLQDCIVCVWRLPRMVTGLKHGVKQRHKY